MERPQVAIVTGAAHGIGLATARRLAGRGMSVAAVDVDGDVLAGAELPEGVRRVVADVADDPTGWLAEVAEQLGLPTVLVNNAARMDGRSFLELPIEEVRLSFDATLFGTWTLTRQVVDRMIEHGLPGSVVFTLSLHSRRVRMCPDYSVAKAGLAMLVQELADELGPYGIRVNSVSPGAIDTWSDRVSDRAAVVARSEAIVPMGRLGAPDEVARAIEFLADPEAGPYVTGADLKVDGGLDQFNWIHHLYGSAEEERNQRS
jgi:NAD(P)-dependent dehydrogenase (short-subunit alcohol dehydrogenase family)